jgi:hypothetical protein
LEERKIGVGGKGYYFRKEIRKFLFKKVALEQKTECKEKAIYKRTREISTVF